jgi:hypothetical protein
MTSCQSSSTENVSCNIAPFFYHHSVVIQHLVSDRRLSLSDTGSHNRLDLIQSLVPPYYVCNGYISWWSILSMEESGVPGENHWPVASHYFFRSFTNVRLLCFVSHSNGMTSCQSSSTENVSCNIAPFFYHHSVVIQQMLDKFITCIVWWYKTVYQVLSVAWTNRITTW